MRMEMGLGMRTEDEETDGHQGTAGDAAEEEVLEFAEGAVFQLW